MPKSKSKLSCEICKKVFERENSEIARNERLGRKAYCSRSCAGKDNYNHLGIHPENLPKIRPSNLDIYSPFRSHLRNMKGNEKNCVLTLADVKEQWDRQEGRCPYTGWALINKSKILDVIPKTPDRASVDRIDNSKKHIVGNIQFVSLIAQYAKYIWKEAELFNFAKAIVDHQSKIETPPLIISEYIDKIIVNKVENIECDNRNDELSPFRRHLCSVHKRKHNYSITLLDLKNQWDKQGGICPYTGWLLKNMANSTENLSFTPDRASLDRIDSSIGYEVNNIQFVSFMAQYAKHIWHESVLFTFAEAVVKNIAKNDISSIAWQL